MWATGRGVIACEPLTDAQRTIFEYLFACMGVIFAPGRGLWGRLGYDLMFFHLRLSNRLFCLCRVGHTDTG